MFPPFIIVGTMLAPRETNVSNQKTWTLDGCLSGSTNFKYIFFLSTLTIFIVQQPESRFPGSETNDGGFNGACYDKSVKMKNENGGQR